MLVMLFKRGVISKGCRHRGSSSYFEGQRMVKFREYRITWIGCADNMMFPAGVLLFCPFILSVAELF